MEIDTLIDKILHLHRADGFVSWRELGYFNNIKSVPGLLFENLDTFKRQLVQNGLLEFADEKQDVTVLSELGRRITRTKHNILKQFIQKLLFEKSSVELK